MEGVTSSSSRGTRVCARSAISSSLLYGNSTPTNSPNARIIFQSSLAIPGGGYTFADLVKNKTRTFSKLQQEKWLGSSLVDIFSVSPCRGHSICPAQVMASGGDQSISASLHQHSCGPQAYSIHTNVEEAIYFGPQANTDSLSVALSRYAYPYTYDTSKYSLGGMCKWAMT